MKTKGDIFIANPIKKNGIQALFLTIAISKFKKSNINKTAATK